jgi:hypothetical protein
MRSKFVKGFLAATVLALGLPAGAAVVPGAGYTVRTFPTPEVVQGGVFRRGNAIFVGQGTFGPVCDGGANDGEPCTTGGDCSGGECGRPGEHIIRLVGASATKIADGFSSLAGMDFDTVTGRVYVVDNCFGSDFGCGNPTTGDTLYHIDDALTRTTAVAASASEVVPSGTFSTPQDVLVRPGQIWVSDAIGVGAGRVATVVGTTVNTQIAGLDFLGGLATDGTFLYVANLDGSFVGSVRKYTLAGAAQPQLIGGLSGAYALAVDGGGNVLVSGGFTGDFSSSTILAVSAGGVATERAHGLGFSSEIFYDAPRGAALVLDFGVTEIAAICADADGDAVCDADVAAPASVAKAKLKIGRQLTPVGDDTLTFKGEMTIPTAPAINPLANGARVLVDDANGRAIVDVVLPGGLYVPSTRVGWTANGGGTAWNWKSVNGEAGITSVKVRTKPGVPGLVKFSVKGKHGAFDTAGAALPVKGVFTLGAAGQGGLATFPGPKPSPSCAIVSGGNTLNCK